MLLDCKMGSRMGKCDALQIKAYGRTMSGIKEEPEFVETFLIPSARDLELLIESMRDSEEEIREKGFYKVLMVDRSGDRLVFEWIPRLGLIEYDVEVTPNVNN